MNVMPDRPRWVWALMAAGAALLIVLSLLNLTKPQDHGGPMLTASRVGLLLLGLSWLGIAAWQLLRRPPRE